MAQRSRKRSLALTGGLLLAVVTIASAAPSLGDQPATRAVNPLKVTCNQLHEEIDKTADQFTAQYNAQGSSIDLRGSFERCYKEGKRVRRGKGYMVDVAPIPGESNPEVSDWFYSWIQVTTRTKKGRLRSVISNFRCDKTIGSPGNAQPGGPC